MSSAYSKISKRRRSAFLVVIGAALVATCSSCGSSTPVSASAAASSAAATAGASSAATTSGGGATVPVASTPSPAMTPTTTAPRPHPKPPSKKPALPLAGKVVGIDPGHNGRNYADPAFLGQIIWNGRMKETCDTAGASTDAGYSEALFNFRVATFLARDLRAEGAKVVMTRTSNNGVGPCVTTRAFIINRAHSNVAIDIHADGGPPGGRGFAILEPVADGPNNHVIGASKRFARILRARYRAVTGMPVSTYDGIDGLQPRYDLAGLNLTTVPKVLIETGNMRNATDAALLVRTSFQKRVARAFTEAIRQYLTR